MGLSGSGKSTMVRHLNRLIEPTAGEVFIGGRDVNKLDPAELRALRSGQIGMVFQNMALLPHRCVVENVALPLELRGMDRQSATTCGGEAGARRPEGLEQPYADELSGGMKQRVGLHAPWLPIRTSC